MKFPLIALGIISAFLTIIYFAAKEDKRQRDLIRGGICTATTDLRTVDKGHLQCVVYGSKGICMSHVWIPHIVEETRYQCPSEAFWRE